uniref:Uncharacterized protein n=1 Tax=Solanum lycopersicum TaxID=4081 RepID=A0A3Q7HYA9_SOLLC
MELPSSIRPLTEEAGNSQKQSAESGFRSTWPVSWRGNDPDACDFVACNLEIFAAIMVELQYILAWHLFGGLARYWSYLGFYFLQRLLKIAAMVGFSLCLRKGESEPPESLFITITVELLKSTAPSANAKSQK